MFGVPATDRSLEKLLRQLDVHRGRRSLACAELLRLELNLLLAILGWRWRVWHVLRLSQV